MCLWTGFILIEYSGGRIGPGIKRRECYWVAKNCTIARVYVCTRACVYMMYNVFNILLLGYAHGTGYSVTIRVTRHLRLDITDAYAGTDGKARVCCILNCTFSYAYWRHLMWRHKTHILKMNYRYVICYVHLPVSRHSGQEMIFALCYQPWSLGPVNLGFLIEKPAQPPTPRKINDFRAMKVFCKTQCQIQMCPQEGPWCINATHALEPYLRYFLVL